MREIETALIEKEVEKLFIDANYHLSADIKKALSDAYNEEKNETSKNILKVLEENYKIAEEGVYPLCQDTGLAVVFLEIGQEIFFRGGYIIDAVNRGIEKAYKNGYLRKSVVIDPLKERINSKNNLPGIIHTEILPGDKLKITVMPKGFGSENQSKIKMMNPTATRDEIIDFIASGVIASGGKGCPPSVIGVGIGGDFEYSAILAKKALLIPLSEKTKDPFYLEMEEEIKDKINKSNTGSMGLGGEIACLGVKILCYPTHIAGLPVAYNYSCHATRHKSVVI